MARVCIEPVSDRFWMDVKYQELPTNKTIFVDYYLQTVDSTADNEQPNPIDLLDRQLAKAYAPIHHSFSIDS